MKERYLKHKHFLIRFLGLCIVGALCALLCVEIYFFRFYAHAFAQLKDDYANYQQGFRRMIAEQQRRDYDLAMAVPGTALKKKS